MREREREREEEIEGERESDSNLEVSERMSVNFINVLQAAFTLADPKKHK